MGDRLGRGLAYTCGGASARERPPRARPGRRPDRGAAGRHRPELRPSLTLRRKPAQDPSPRHRRPTVAPTPGIGEPDGRMGIQDQVTPIGREAAAFHDNWLLPLCALISVFVLALLLWAMIRYPPRRQPDAVAQLAQHDDRGDLDAGPGADPGRASQFPRSGCCATNIRRRRPT